MKRSIAWTLLVLFCAIIACGGPGTAPNPTPVPPEVKSSGPKGPAIPPDVSVIEDQVDLGSVDCGGGPSSDKVVKITNVGGGIFSWTAELELPGFALVGPTSGTFSGAGSTAVRVRANPIPSSAAAGLVVRTTLVIVIDRAKIYRVPLIATAHGATFTVTPETAAFGDWPINNQAPDIPLTIKNVGNGDATVSFTQPSAADFALAWTGAPADIAVPAGATVPGAVASFRPARLTSQNTAAGLKVTKGAVCGQSATGVAMSGKGTGGVVGITPAVIDFAKVNCGAAGGVKSFTILNSGNSSFTWSATLASGINYDLSSSGSVLLAGQQTSVIVTPHAIPQQSAITDNLYGDTLTITTDAANDTPHTIDVKMTAQGAIISFAQPSLSFGPQGIGIPAAGKTLGIVNMGNLGAKVKLSPAGAALSSFTATPSVATNVAAGTTLPGSVSFRPLGFGAISDTVSLSSADVLCQPPPDAVPVDGIGKGIASQISISTSRKYNASTSACALLTSGYVACWGSNTFGQLGDGTTSASAMPTLVRTSATTYLTGVTQVDSAALFNCGLKSGTVYCWGAGLNDNNNSDKKGSYAAATTATGATFFSAGHRHFCYLKPDAGGNSNVTCIGMAHDGQTAGTGITNATSVAASGSGGCALIGDKSVKCWGNNYHGERGDGTTNGPFTAVTVSGITTATAIAGAGAGGRSSLHCAIKTDKTAACWGNNSNNHARGGRGPGQGASFATPQPVLGLANITQIALGTQHACALAGGDVYCWGSAEGGALGNDVGGNPIADGTLPTKVGIANVSSLVAGTHSTCALLADSSVNCWGAIGSGAVPGF